MGAGIYGGIKRSVLAGQMCIRDSIYTRRVTPAEEKKILQNADKANRLKAGNKMCIRDRDDTAGLGSVDLNRITPMPVWMREEPLSAGTVRRQGGENCWLDWRRQTGERGGTR